MVARLLPVLLLATTALGLLFEQNKYVLSESEGGVMMCVQAPDPPLQAPLEFFIVDEPDTALRDQDYIPIGEFGAVLNVSVCFSLSQYIVDDRAVEGTKVFTVRLIATNGSIRIDTAAVYIIDNDGAHFRLVNRLNPEFGAGIFSITETNVNMSLPVCAELVTGGETDMQRAAIGLEREAVLLITTMERAADSNDFLVVNNKTLTFPTGSTNSLQLCEEIIIFGDIIPEQAELFMFSVSTADSLDVIEGPTSSTVIIQNDDPIPDCGQPPSPGERGVVMYNSTLLGFRAVYSCEVGYQLEPRGGTDSERVCLLSGNWSGVDLTCTIVNCSILTPPLLGAVVLNQTSFGAVAVYACLRGYQLLGNSSRTCQANGQWSSRAPLCKAVDCGDLSEPDNGFIAINSTTFTSTASYSCATGHELVGNDTRTCVASGNWSGNQPQCGVVNCGLLESPRQGHVTITTSVYLSLAIYSCDTGYMNTSNLVRVCEASGQWSSTKPNCTDIDECFLSEDDCHSNASCTNTLGGFSCSCQLGFQGDGQTCLDINECSLDKTNCSQGCENSVGSFQCVCNQGYRLAHDGQLCNNINECEDGTHGCHANANCMDTEGSFTCSCKEGFTGEGFNCTAIDCGRLEAPQNGAISLANSSTRFSSVAIYSCLRGFNMIGEASRVCLVSGGWSGQDPVCRVVDCGPLPDISLGGVKLLNGSTVYASVAEYQCVTGYLLANGDERRECLSTGLWSGRAPVCLSEGSVTDTSVDIVVVAVGVSVGGFSLAVIIVSILLLTAVYQVRQRGREKVYGVDSHGTWTGSRDSIEPVTLRYTRPIYVDTFSEDTHTSHAFSDLDSARSSTEFPLSERSRPTYADMNGESQHQTFL
ncbi:CUB and sushi domain-containing protein 3-like isoform X2 [Halichondria panicea]|uniref:CUB and sushi domain-containing protein 3-like isoform X2 n=1 Tax=Halichondria panicea TaxID=6063 RepID=UPI00312B4337